MNSNETLPQRRTDIIKPSLKDMSYAELGRQLYKNILLLTSNEFALARNDLREVIRAESLMTRRLIIGAVFITTGTACLAVALIMLLQPWLPAWLSALILGALFLIAGFSISVSSWHNNVSLTQFEKDFKVDQSWISRTKV